MFSRTRRAAFTATVLAVFAVAVFASQEQVPEAVSTESRYEGSEVVYRLSAGGCNYSLTAYRSEVNRGVIRLRSTCDPVKDEGPAVIGKLFDTVRADDKNPAARTLAWGRIAPDGMHDTAPARRLALAAHRSERWDTRRGRPVEGHANPLTIELLNRIDVAPELAGEFAARGIRLRVSGAEKVLVERAGDQPFFDWLKEHGVAADERLPIDCQLWFALEPIPEAESRGDR